MELIRIENVTKDYLLAGAEKANISVLKKALGIYHGKESKVLNDISLDINEGEIVGIIGRNGCGKSTLLKMISGIITPSSGKIFIKGKVSAILELGFGLNPEFNAFQNIRFVSSIIGIPRSKLSETIADVLNFAELKEYAYEPVKHYSSGMRARLAFAIATATSPDILIIDEVLAVGDGIFRRKCNHRMQSLIEKGKTVLYVSHNMNAVRDLCNRVLLLEKGNVVLDGDPKTVTRAYEEIMNTGGLKDPDKYRELINRENGIKSTDIDLRFETKQADITLKQCTFDSLEYKQTGQLTYLGSDTLKLSFSFSEQANNISVGIAIKDHQGQTVAGVVEPSFLQDIDEVKAEDTLEVIWEFDVRILPGAYFVAIDIRQNNRSDSLYVIEDAITFKVTPKKKHRNVGIANIDKSISHSIISGSV